MGSDSCGFFYNADFPNLRVITLPAQIASEELPLLAVLWQMLYWGGADCFAPAGKES